MTEPKEQAVPVVGVGEAVERLKERLLVGADWPVVSVVRDDLRKVLDRLQALQGSSACADTHRATEQPVVGTWWTQYRRSQIGELRPYVPGEPMELLDRVSISQADLDAGSPKEGDMIARNPANHDDQWLVAADYFAANFEPLAQAENRKLGGDEAEGEVNHLQAQLKAAYEALELIVQNCGWTVDPDTLEWCPVDDHPGDIACQALARRGEG